MSSSNDESDDLSLANTDSVSKITRDEKGIWKFRSDFTLEERRAAFSDRDTLLLSSEFKLSKEQDFTLKMPKSREARSEIENWEIELLKAELENKKVLSWMCGLHGAGCSDTPNRTAHRSINENGTWVQRTNECYYTTDYNITKEELENKKYTLQYLTNPVGSFVGCWDRPITEVTRLGHTSLSFSEYTSWQHSPEDTHFKFSINDDKVNGQLMDRLECLEIEEEIDTQQSAELCGPAQERFENEVQKQRVTPRIIYTCKSGKCKIPCVCDHCANTEEGLRFLECSEHTNIDRKQEFDQDKHLSSVRNSDSLQLNHRRFGDGLLPYGGMPNLDIDGANKRCVYFNKHKVPISERYDDPTHKKPISERYDDPPNPACNRCPCPTCPFCKIILIIKFPGVPKDCEQCVTDLCNHEAYHLIEHYNCKFCSAIGETYNDTRNNKEFFTHLWNISADAYYNCQECGKEFSDVKNKQQHIRFVHKGYLIPDIKCKQCEFTTKYQKSMNSHIHIKHKTNYIYYECDKCNYKSVQKKNLTEHKKIVHEKNSQTQFQCDKCNYKSIQESNFKRHKKTVHFQCDKCKYETDNKSKLISHEKTVHDKQSRSLFQCEQCEYKNILKSEVTKHTKRVHK